MQSENEWTKRLVSSSKNVPSSFAPTVAQKHRPMNQMLLRARSWLISLCSVSSAACLLLHSSPSYFISMLACGSQSSWPSCSPPTLAKQRLFPLHSLSPDSTNTWVSWSISVGCVALRWAPPAVGSTRGTLGSGKTPRPPPSSERANQRRDIFIPLPCCSLAPTYWLCGLF